jgi:hypothetical protein
VVARGRGRWRRPEGVGRGGGVAWGGERQGYCACEKCGGSVGTILTRGQVGPTLGRQDGSGVQ